MKDNSQGKITVHDPKIYFVKDILSHFALVSHFAPGYANAPYKSMYSKQKIIQILEKFFQNMNCFFLDQANSSSIPSEILILQFPRTRASLSSSPSLWYFALANKNSSSTQSSSHSLSVSLFFPTPFDHTPSRVLDKLNPMPSQACQIFYQAIYRS